MKKIKVESSQVIEFLEEQKNLIKAIMDFPREGDEGWKENMMHYISDQVLGHHDKFYQLILSMREDKEVVRDKGNIYPAGSKEERIYAYAAKFFRNLSTEEIFLPDNDIQCLMENSIYENPDARVLKGIIETFFNTYIRIREEAFEYIIVERRKKEKIQTLF